MKSMSLTCFGTNYHCDIHFNQYQDGSPAIQLISPLEGPVCTCTVCLPDHTHLLQSGQCFIKTWSENEGVLEQLEAAGIVRDTGRIVPTGFCTASIADILIPIETEA